jgi:hypothetical protein
MLTNLFQCFRCRLAPPLQVHKKTDTELAARCLVPLLKKLVRFAKSQALFWL